MCVCVCVCVPKINFFVSTNVACYRNCFALNKLVCRIIHNKCNILKGNHCKCNIIKRSHYYGCNICSIIISNINS